MSTNDNTTTSTCAACGKEGDNLKSCVACKLVKYCNRDCQVSHRRAHKKECKKRAAELYDEQLFKEPSPPEQCPICKLFCQLIQNNPLLNHVVVKSFAMAVLMC